MTENTRLFAACLKGKANTCSYTFTCPKHGCNQVIDFADIFLKDAFVTGLADEDKLKKLLGWGSLYKKSVNKTISFIKEKEMVGDTKRQPVITTSFTSYKSLKKTTQKPSGIITCSMLINQLINMFGAVKT